MCYAQERSSSEATCFSQVYIVNVVTHWTSFYFRLLFLPPQTDPCGARVGAVHWPLSKTAFNGFPLRVERPLANRAFWYWNTGTRNSLGYGPNVINGPAGKAGKRH